MGVSLDRATVLRGAQGAWRALSRSQRATFVASLLVVAVSSVVLLGARWADPDRSAEHYFARENRPLYGLMQLCYVVLLTALAFNARYMLYDAAPSMAAGALRAARVGVK